MYVGLGILLLLAIYAPFLWVRYVMWRHSKDLPQIPGTGAELAQHLAQKFKLDIKVEETDAGADHFDPDANAVRLGPLNFHGRSLTAIAVATHEVGHAIQHDRKEAVNELRTKYLPRAYMIKKVGIAILMLTPVITGLLHVPAVALITILIGLGTMLLSSLMYLLVLPHEWDASFNKALPVLIQGEYIEKSWEPAVRSILRAAALTYFAGALADLLRIWRWWLVFRGLR